MYQWATNWCARKKQNKVTWESFNRGQCYDFKDFVAKTWQHLVFLILMCNVPIYMYNVCKNWSTMALFLYNLQFFFKKGENRPIRQSRQNLVRYNIGPPLSGVPTAPCRKPVSTSLTRWAPSTWRAPSSTWRPCSRSRTTGRLWSASCPRDPTLRPRWPFKSTKQISYSSFLSWHSTYTLAAVNLTIHNSNILGGRQRWDHYMNIYYDRQGNIYFV
jgi:hypothetical protein